MDTFYKTFVYVTKTPLTSFLTWTVTQNIWTSIFILYVYIYKYKGGTPNAIK